MPSTVSTSSGAVGTATTYAKADHTHPFTGVPTPSDLAPQPITTGSASAGTSALYSRQDHVHKFTLPAIPSPSDTAPSFVQMTGQSAGTASTYSRSDHKHQMYFISGSGDWATLSTTYFSNTSPYHAIISCYIWGSLVFVHDTQWLRTATNFEANTAYQIGDVDPTYTPLDVKAYPVMSVYILDNGRAAGIFYVDQSNLKLTFLTQNSIGPNLRLIFTPAAYVKPN
jgi:hypothetical protein